MNKIYCGLDCSTTATGWSIFQDKNLVAHGTIKPKSSDEWRDRIRQEWGALEDIVTTYNPEKIFIEDVPLKDGKLTLVKLGAMQGLILALSAKYNIQMEFLLPSDWRQPLGLYDGTREGTHRDVLKKKAINMANEKFGLDLLWVAPKSKKNMDDEAEAILICYSQLKKKVFKKT